MMGTINIMNIQKDDRKHIILLIIAFFFIHGQMVYNTLAWHDEVLSIFGGWSGGLEHGRFTQRWIADIFSYIAGIDGSPVFHSLIGSICIAIMIVLLYKLGGCSFKKEPTIAIIFLAIPAVAGNMGYMSTFGYNALGALFGVYAAYVIAIYNGLKHYIFGTILFALSIGEYQCYVPLFMSVLLLSYSLLLIEENIDDIKILYIGIKYVICSIVGLFIYLIVLKVSLKLYDVKLVTYAGTNTFGLTNIVGYANRIRVAYIDFLTTGDNVQWSMFPFHWVWWHRILLIILLVGFLLNIIYMVRKKKTMRACGLILILLVVPLVFNFQFIMTDVIHSLHMYHFAILFMMTFCLMKKGAYSLFKESNPRTAIIRNFICETALIYFGIVGLLYIRYDNVCYLSAEVQQQKAISYFSTLVSDIHAVNGYQVDLPVCFINERSKTIPQTFTSSSGDVIVTNPYNVNILNSNTWRIYMDVWCNYSPSSEIQEKDIGDETRGFIEQMPNYPNDGSIEVKDGILIVKF